MTKILLDHAPKHFNVYYEPFLGAGTLFLALQPKKAVVGDINEWLPLMFIAVQHRLQALMQRLDALQLAYAEARDIHEYWAELLAYFNKRVKTKYTKSGKLSDHFLSHIAIFMFILKKSFGGHIWYKADGTFRARLAAKHVSDRAYNPELLLRVKNYLDNNEITLKTGDYTEILASAGKDDFVYLDPPYYITHTENLKYSTTPFKKLQHVRIAQVFKELHERKCLVLMSNSDDPFIRQLYDGYNVKVVVVKRFLYPGQAEGIPVKELLISNY